MDGRTLLIADSSEEFRLALSEALQGTYCVRACGNGPEALSLLRSFSPDILVLDLGLPGLDGISLLQSAAESGICPMVLASSLFISPYIVDAVSRFGVEYLMCRPCDIRGTVERIGDLSQRLQPQLISRPTPMTHISNLLLGLGLRSNLDGYSYLREAVLLMARQPDIAITKELYPAVASQFGVTWRNVEHSMRTAIEKAWACRDDQIWRMYFSPGPDGSIPRPANTLFISRLADSLLLRQEQQVG